MCFSRSHDAPLLDVYTVLELEYSHLHLLPSRSNRELEGPRGHSGRVRL